MGKVLIVNTLVASLFVHKMMVLPGISEEHVKQIENLIEEFLWNKHKPKIPLWQLQLNKLQGGLNLVNLRWKDAALKVAWIQILDKNFDIANLVYKNIGHPLRNKLWSCNIRAEDVDEVFPCPSFWKDVEMNFSILRVCKIIS